MGVVMTPYKTHRTVYRETQLTVTLREDGSVLSVASRCGDNVTELLTDERLEELAAHCRKEME
jgi:hypothetical protein